ncbi:histidine kinase [Nitrospira sp. KM1]|uniref:Hpt domain-containing protein n=1 Tax=Nitrospira sp. KM1 TaxID=1936990 RepID=UPI0013A72C10|nr:Hpt domain-containing protein [Nitrospira sp. KM1]BCA54748.1 histidine kinase [Nitrospira sp. KM1]
MDARAVFDFEQVLASLDGDQALFVELAVLFLEESPKELAAARAALDRSDAQSLATAAHRLKGSVLQFCAHSVSECAKQLEELGRSGDLATAGTAYRTMEVRLQELSDALNHVLAEGRVSSPRR